MLVIAEDIATGFMMGEADSESNGEYSIDGLPAGSYRVYTIDDFDQGYVDEYYDGAADTGSATTVVVTGTDETSGIDFTLESE